MTRLVHFLFLAVLTAFMFSVDYETEIQPIFNDNCGSCHLGNYSGGLNLSSYEDLMAGGTSGASVEAGNSAGSVLYDRITRDNADTGDMPPGNSELSQSDIDMIAMWIDEGALAQEQTCDDVDACNYGEEGDCEYSDYVSCDCDGNVMAGYCDCDGNMDFGCGCGEPAAEEGFDCDGNCLLDIDCAGECGGSAVEDECGECNGDGSSCSDDGGEDSGDPANFDCQIDSDCLDGEFCAVECFSGPCGLDGSETEGTAGQYCQPCDECEYDQDAVSGNCDACGGTSDDGGDDGGYDEIPECLLDCEGVDTLLDIMYSQDFDGLCELYVSWSSCVDDCPEDVINIDEFNDMQDQCEDCLSDPYLDCSDIDGEGDDGGGDGAPECMMDCAGVETVDPEEDANAFCEWYIVAYDDTTCMDDCDDGYYGGIVAQIYAMCDMCLPLGNCDEIWSDCSDLDQSECEDNADCSWHDDDMMCDDLYCSDLDQSECEGNDNCDWDGDTMECDEVSDDGPPECWLDCEGALDVLHDEMTGTELCTWFVPVYEGGSCLGDCDQDEMFASTMMYSICSECLLDGSCDDAFDDGSCSDLSQSDCDDEEECQWNDYDMACEDMDCSTLLDETSCEENGFCDWNEYEMECESSGDDGPPTCLQDCPGIWDVDPDENPTAFCEWYIPTYDDGSCMDDCDAYYMYEFDMYYSVCQDCLAVGNCDDAFDDDDCSDYDNEYDCDMYGCDWDSDYMECNDAGGNGPPECLMDCSGVYDLDEACSNENATEEECMAAYCSFVNSNYSDDGESCWDDCEDMYNPEMDGSLEDCGLIDLGNSDSVPIEYGISGAYPNPFNPYATIEFTVPNYSNVKLYLIDANGHIIKDLDENYYAPGVYTVGIDGSGYSSGIYFVRMVAGAHASTQKLILLK